MTALVQQDRLDEAVETGRRALPLTRNPEVRSVRPEIMEWLALALAVGPAPLEESEAFARELLADDELGPSVEWLALLTLALARGPLGHLEEARTLVGRAKAIATELGLDVNAAATSIQLAQVELLAGDVRDAEAELREAAAQLTKRGAANLLASIAAYLALLLGARGELDEALELAEQAERLASPEDVEVRVMALGVTRARFASASGAHEQAEAAARSALPKATSGHVFMSTLAYETLGDVLRAAGREPDAVRAYEQALQLHERKGHVLAAERLRKTIGAPPRLPLRPVRG